MPHRLSRTSAIPSKPRLHLASALRQVFQQGYHLQDLKSDFIAGLIVGIVALPLSMALAIASGVPPQYGLYTAIVAGFLTPIFGGSRTSVSGPTGAFVVVLAPIAVKFGLGGLLLATLLAGIILLMMGIGKLGKLIEFIPHPVTTGFTSGIAVVIATLQIKDFFGLTIAQMPEHYSEKIIALAQAMPTLKSGNLVIGLFTLGVLIIGPRFTKRIPVPLIALTLAAILGVVLTYFLPQWSMTTIGSQFSYIKDGIRTAGIPALPPVLAWPWTFPGPGGAPLHLSFGLIQSLLGPALAIALLGAIESLLCAVVADGMTGTKHDPNGELIAQGIGNIAAPLFGGIAATAAVARTATNIRAGAKSPIAAIIHALFVLAAVLGLAPLLSYLPMSALAALLFMVAWNMSDAKHFIHMLKVAPKSDLLVLLSCFTLTVVFDMVIAVSVGIVLAALLFMRRMAEISHFTLSTGQSHRTTEPLPAGVILYEIAGPLFFGAAQKAIEALETVSHDTKTVIILIESVPSMDVTGLVALQSAIEKLHAHHIKVIIAGVQPQPARVLTRGGIVNDPGKLMICGTMDEALSQISGCH